MEGLSSSIPGEETVMGDSWLVLWEGDVIMRLLCGRDVDLGIFGFGEIGGLGEGSPRVGLGITGYEGASVLGGVWVSTPLSTRICEEPLGEGVSEGDEV